MKEEKVFKENVKFFKWIEENKEKIKNIRITLNDKIIRVKYEKI